MTGTIHSLRQAAEIRSVFAPVLGRLEDVETFFEREFGRSIPPVAEVAGYTLGSGGKRIRPALVLLIARMLGYSGERDVRYGAVVEFIHTATLIHDDIIDESDLRRGRPTANRRFGNQATVLVGDWLYSKAMDLCLELGDVEVMRLLNGATLEMTEGEILADGVRGRVDIDEELYLDITRRKTAELFAAACALPALFQASTHHLTEPLLAFGRDLGMCFQLVDDLLDFTSSRKQLGKPVMADLREGRATLPIILLLPRLSERQRQRVAAVASTGAFEEISEQELLEMVTTSGVLEETRRRAAAYSARVERSVERLPAGSERDSLLRAVTLILDRKR